MTFFISSLYRGWNQNKIRDQLFSCYSSLVSMVTFMPTFFRILYTCRIGVYPALTRTIKRGPV